MRHTWDQAAKLRQEQIESGKDITFSNVFLPYYRDLVLALKPASVLEIGCGTGHLALDLNKYISRFDALEPNAGMFNVATDVLKGTSVHVEKCRIEDYRLHTYDLIISHLCTQMVEELVTFFNATARFLREKSVFVFSIPHPCFWNKYKQFFRTDDYKYIVEQYKEVTLTITKDPGQPIEQVPYYHRPLNSYFKALGKARLCVVNLDEIYPDKEVQMLYGALWEEPRYCVFYTRTSRVGKTG